MSQKVALVTGAGGEMGQLLIPALHERGFDVIALDLSALPDEIRAQCVETVEASILDNSVLQDLFERHAPSHVFHLAAVLSRKAEADPELAHRVNVQGTYQLMQMAREIGGPAGQSVRVLFPSSIAVYGLPSPQKKEQAGAVHEVEWNLPTGMYGCNKLYCELLGSYFTRIPGGIDFRSIRFPGLISAETLPTGGTTDYAPEMIHAAAQGQPYRCFVVRDARLPFMTMPDAIESLLRLGQADATALSTRVYNIRGFSASAGEIRAETLKHFAEATIRFEPDPVRQAMVDSWPSDVDDSAARKDWGFAPRHDLAVALREYLVPAMRRRYSLSAS